MILDNVYARKVIMMIIQKIFVNNAQLFGFLL